MKNRTRSLLFTLLAVIVTLIGMAAGIYFNAPQSEGKIILPQKTDGENIDMNDIRGENVRMVETVVVDENNVLGLVSRLRRPSEYHFLTENTVYSGSDSRVITSEGYVKGTKAKVVQSENGIEKLNCIVTDRYIYMWENGRSNYEKLGKGSFSYDDMIFVPAYEELKNFESIEQARSFDIDGEKYIEVTGSREGSEISETYLISVSTGLVSSVIFKNDSETLSTTSVTLLSTAEISENVFLLPDNSIAG